MTDEIAIKKDLLRNKCDDVLGSLRSRTPLTYKGFPSYATFQPPPFDMDETTGDATTFDNRHWGPLPNSSKLDRQTLMAKHHFVAEPDWLPPVQTVQHRVPRPRSRGVKLRSVEDIVKDTQRQKALSSEERAGYTAAKTPPRQQSLAQRQPPPPPKSKVLDFLNEIAAVSRPSSSNSSSTKSALTPTTSNTQNGTIKKSQQPQQQPSTPNKKQADPQHPFKKPVHPSTATPPPSTTTISTTPNAAASTPRSAPRQTGTEKASNKSTDVVSKSRPQSSDTNLDLFITKQFLINDMGDPAATRHLEDLSRSNAIEKRPILRVRIMLKKKSPSIESKPKEVIKKSKNDTQSSPAISSDTSPFNLPTGTIPTEFIRSMKIRKKSKSDQAASSILPSSQSAPSHKSSRSHIMELEEGETISPSPSPRRPLSISPDRTKLSSKRQRDDGSMDDHEHQKQQVRRNKSSKKEISSVPLSSSSSASSTSSSSKHAINYDNVDDRHHSHHHHHRHDSSTGSMKSGMRKDRYNDEDRKSTTSSSSKRLERSISGSGGDDYSDSKRRSRRSSSSSRRSREDDIISSSSSNRHHRSSQRSSSSRLRQSSRSRSRSPRRRSSSSSSNTRSSSLEKSRRHTPLTTTTTIVPTTTTTTATSSRDSQRNKSSIAKSALPSSTTTATTTTTTTTTSSSSNLPNGPGTPKDSGRVKETLETPKNTYAKELAPTPTTSIPSPAVLAMAKEATKNNTASAITAIKNSASKVALDNDKQYPAATSKNSESPGHFRIFTTMFQRLALTYKRRGDQADTEITGLLDHVHTFLNFILAFHYHDRQSNNFLQDNWNTLHPFSAVLLQKLRSTKNKERQGGALYGLCLRMNALVHFYIFSRRELMARTKLERLCQQQPSALDDVKRLEYSKTVQKILQDHEVAYQALRESENYLSYDMIQSKFPISYQNVCIHGQVGAGIVVGGEAGVSVGPMYPLVPYARLHHAAIMAKCILQEFVDKEQIEYTPITKTEEYM